MGACRASSERWSLLIVVLYFSKLLGREKWRAGGGDGTWLGGLVRWLRGGGDRTTVGDVTNLYLAGKSRLGNSQMSLRVVAAILCGIRPLEGKQWHGVGDL